MIHNQVELAANALKERYYYITSLLELDSEIFGPMFSLEYKTFKSSWNNLELDNHMADNGKYRYRRYSVINCYPNLELEYLPIEPHFQKIEYNDLNGGVFRHYSPFEERVLRSLLLKKIINLCCRIFNQVKYKSLCWRVECHQFRVIPPTNESAFPTPEGRHRDGVEYVFMMLIERKNITGGVTNIYNHSNACVATHTLELSQECILLDDTKVMHEVSPVNSGLIDTSYRDVMVLTFRQANV